MPKDYEVFLEDILSSIDKIQAYVGDVSFDEFVKNEMRVDAVVRNLTIIGEAAGRIPPEARRKYQSIEWKKIVGLRNILMHAYSGIDLEILWDIIKNKLPVLKKNIGMIVIK